MRPEFALDNVVDRSIGQPIPLGQHPVGLGSWDELSSDGSHVLLGQLTAWVEHSLGHMASYLLECLPGELVRKMSPGLPGTESPSLVARGPEHLSDEVAADSMREQLTHKPDLPILPLCIRMVLAIQHMVASTFYHVSHIVLLCAQPQMFRVNTWRVVTIMDYRQPDRNISVVNPPRNPMGRFHMPIDVAVAMTEVLTASGPDPAMFSLADLGPEVPQLPLGEFHLGPSMFRVERYTPNIPMPFPIGKEGGSKWLS